MEQYFIFFLEVVGRPHHLRIVIDVERIDFHTFNYVMDPLPMYNKNVGVVIIGQKNTA